MKKFFTFIAIIFIIFVISFYFQFYKKYNLKNTQIIIKPQQKQITKFIDKNLFNKPALPIFWKIYLRITQSENRLKAGIYKFDKQKKYSRANIINILLKGPAKKTTKQITIIEGLNNDEIVNYLSKQNIRITGVIKKSNVLDYRAKYEFLEKVPDKKSLQGFLFPDTYEIYIDSTEEEIMLKMLDNFNKKVYKKIKNDLKGKDFYKIIILASIIEKEVKDFKDKKIVAGIFYNRLKIGMPLQSDATINYITKSGRTRSTLKDLQIKSPYNTYKNPGLPPEPISNPGLESILAALKPEQTDYLYFLTDSKGNVFYAKTFKQHIYNKRKFLK